jgi:pimeloyl-ACP methyl ester carboxylesterase
MKKIKTGFFLRMIIYAILLVVVLSLPQFLLFTIPPRKITNISPKAYSLEYQDVTLHTKDGMTLAGWFIPNKNSDKAIIVCHGYPMDKGDIFGVTEFLARHYNLLYFDFRGMGSSSGRISTSGWREKEDVLTAVRFLKDKGFSRIGAFGFSMGAAAILMANSPDIKCIISDSSYAVLSDVLLVIFNRSGPLRPFVFTMSKVWARLLLGVNTDEVAPVKYISGLHSPILLIHCTQDTTIPVDQAQKLKQADPQAKLWLIPNGDHGESSLSNDYDNTIINFLNSHL